MGDDPIPGLSDLATACPSVAAEWHPEKNGDLAPERVRAGSLRPVWWLGACGHSWEATVLSRAVLGEGCPICAGRPPLREAHPSLAAEWHPTRNGKTAPDDVTAGSTRPAWWLGKCGHEWRAGVGSRARGAGCPYCSGKRALAGFNDLATTHPDLAAAWHPERNGSLGPADVVAGGAASVWWLCPRCGASWKSQLCNRVRGRRPLCPECSRREGAAKRLRPVRCVETGAAYPCAADAAAAMGLKSRQSISQACRKPGTTAAGFHWEYA